LTWFGFVCLTYCRLQTWIDEVPDDRFWLYEIKLSTVVIGFRRDLTVEEICLFFDVFGYLLIF